MSRSGGDRKLALVYPGPNYTPVDSFSERLTELSKHYSGFMLTTSPKAQLTRIAEFDIHCVSTSGGKLRTLLRQVRLVVRLGFEARRSGGLDLVSSYDPLRSGLLALLLKHITGCKFVCEVNGDYAEPANYLDVPNPIIRKLKRRVFMVVEKFVVRQANGVKLLYVRQLASLELQKLDAKISIFPNRVAVERFKPMRSTKTILTVGFPWQVKGIDLTIRAFKQVSPRFPEWRMQIVGWFRYPKPLLELIDDDPQIDLAKPLPYSEMPELIGSCGIFVLASRTESMGRVLIEAMAAGKPRIGTFVGGIPQVINDQVDGVLVEPDNVIQLAAAMQILMSNEDLRNMLGEAASGRAKKEFSKGNYYSNLTGFYESVLAEN